MAEALGTLIRQDIALLVNDTGERTIASRLACYMVPLFQGYDVDVEYNRHGIDVKILSLPPECHGGGNRRVVPDIIVHRRGNDLSNLLAIELKKDTNPEPRDCDRAKLVALKQQFVYRYALLLEVACGGASGLHGVREEWV